MLRYLGNSKICKFIAFLLILTITSLGLELFSYPTYATSTDKVVRAILPLDAEGNLLLSTEGVEITKVKLIYDDDSVEVREQDATLRYTPHGSVREADLIRLKEALSSVDFLSLHPFVNYREIRFSDRNDLTSAYRKKHGRNPTEEELRAEIIRFQLDSSDIETSFRVVQNNLETLLKALFEHSTSVNVDNIINNKEKFLLALSFLYRQYRFNFGTMQVADLLLFYPQAFTASANDAYQRLNSLATTINENVLNLFLNINTYTTKIAPLTNEADIIAFLEKGLALFSNKQIDLNTWLKEASKAHIVETSSEYGTSSIVDKMRRDNIAKSHLIPLLTVSEDSIYLISTTNTLTYGLYDTYINQADKENTTRKFLENVTKTAQHQQKFLDFWYRLTEKKTEFRNHPPIVVQDTMRKFSLDPSAERSWSPKYGAEASIGVKEFFQPLKLYRNFFFADGEASGNKVSFFLARALEDRGQSTYTHELTHILDRSIWFNGLGRRRDKKVEVYARGLFESVNLGNTEHSQPFFNLNTAYTLDENRVQNQTPDRFSSDEDIKEFSERSFDVIYSLDLLEAELILEKSKEDRAILLNKVMLVPASENEPKYTDATLKNDKFVPLTEDEAERLSTIDDFVDLNLVSGRFAFKGMNPFDTTIQNGYYVVPMFEPVYAALQNDQGTVGDFTFRRNAYDILGEYGYNNGMLPYLSGKYDNDAVALQHILATKYNGNLASFKKDMFKRRKEKISELKSIEGYTNLEDIKNKMRVALNEDLARIKANKTSNPQLLVNGVSRLNNLKADIYKKYLLLTNDFRSSVYETKYNVRFRFEKMPNVSETLPVSLENRLIGKDRSEIAEGTSLRVEDAHIDLSDLPTATGTWSFGRWDKETATINGADVTFTGTWNFTPKTYSVSYTFDKKEDTQPTLPTELTNRLNGKNSLTGLSNGVEVTSNNIDTSNFEDTVNKGRWEFVEWTPSLPTNINGQNLEVVGKWNFVPNTYNVTYTFTKADGVREDLPAEITTRLNGKNRANVRNGTEVSVYEAQILTEALETETGSWTFVNWDKREETVNGADVSFTGTWNFTPKTYSVSYTFDKKEDTQPTLPTELTNRLNGKNSLTGLSNGVEVTSNNIDTSTIEDTVNKGRWEFVEWTPSLPTNINGQNLEVVGKWNFVPNTYNVTYTFMKAEGVTEDLPAEITTRLNDKNKTNVANGTSVNVTGIDTATYETANGSWTFGSWDKQNATVDGANVSFTGTWNFTPKTYSVNFSFEKKAEVSEDIPQAIRERLTNKNKTNVANGTEIRVADESIDTSELQTATGTWRFESWDKPTATVNGSDVSFTGIWNFIPKEDTDSNTNQDSSNNDSSNDADEEVSSLGNQEPPVVNLPIYYLPESNKLDFDILLQNYLTKKEGKEINKDLQPQTNTKSNIRHLTILLIIALISTYYMIVHKKKQENI